MFAFKKDYFEIYLSFYENFNGKTLRNTYDVSAKAYMPELGSIQVTTPRSDNLDCPRLP